MNLLSPHFTYHEMTQSETATRLKIDNTPNAEELANLIHTCDRMEKVRQFFRNTPIRVSSGFRSKALNKAVGGSINSDHVKGFAVDFNVTGLSPVEAFKLLAMEQPFKWDQLILEYKRWIHISFAPRLRGQTFTIG
jgi:hypothetical protein